MIFNLEKSQKRILKKVYLFSQLKVYIFSKLQKTKTDYDIKIGGSIIEWQRGGKPWPSHE